MGIEVWVRGEVDQPAATDLLVRAAAWFGNRVGDELLHATVGADRQQRPRLLVSLYPGAEDVEITLDETRLEVSGKTSTIGPGYHAYVCELLEELGAELSIGWLPPAQDEDDYFRTRDAGALELEFLNWLNGLARFAVDKFETGGAQGITVSMPLSVRFVEDSFMITPMGPRSVDWAREVARDPRRGIDVFPWWDPGKDGSYALGRAMVLMWQDVPWRAPTDDDEMALLRRVDTLLTQADTLTATSPLPWAEWGEILTYLGESRQEVETRAASSLPPQIGYRRGEAWNELSGQWWVRTPGAFVGRFEDEGSWSAFDGVLTLWFSSFAIKKDDGSLAPVDGILPESAPTDGRPVSLPALDGTPYRASLSVADDDENGEYLCLTTEVAAPGRLGLLTVAFSDQADLSKAVDIASTLRNGSP
ncbi:hypothetical protein GCM10009765_04740 [Fodinicola feengrottensis]|uniref:Uncharacterized protein n=1 Tax=Fodinicola feengrottensis TaxID=435914 RepID=A0ABP4RNA3_9ACTN